MTTLDPQIKEAIETVMRNQEDSLLRIGGKIESIENTLNSYMKKMEPVYEVYDTANRVGNFIPWLSKVLVSIGLIVASIAGAIKFLGK